MIWDQWFKSWLNAIFWWLPRKETDDDRRHDQSKPPEAEKEVATDRPAAQPSASGNEPDDLTVIKGLGPAMQRKLQAEGITTFAELADADAEALTNKLKPTQRTLTKDKIESWIKAARDRGSSA